MAVLTLFIFLWYPSIDKYKKEAYMSHGFKTTYPQDVSSQINLLRNKLRLDAATLHHMDQLCPMVQLSELKMMHHLAIQIAKNALRKGATIH